MFAIFTKVCRVFLPFLAEILYCPSLCISNCTYNCLLYFCASVFRSV